MNDYQEKLYRQAENVAQYNAMSLRAMALTAHLFRHDKEAMRIFSFVWARNARHIAKAVDIFDLHPENPEPLSTDEFLSMFAIASLPKHAAALLASDWKNKTMPYWEVRERVDKYKKRDSKTTKEPKVCDMKTIGDQLFRVVKAHHLQGDTEYGVGCEVCGAMKMWEALQ